MVVDVRYFQCVCTRVWKKEEGLVLSVSEGVSNQDRGKHLEGKCVEIRTAG